MMLMGISETKPDARQPPKRKALPECPRNPKNHPSHHPNHAERLQASREEGANVALDRDGFLVLGTDHGLHSQSSDERV